MEERIDLVDGKYTVIYNEQTGDFRALRYKEEWRSLVGDKLFLALFTEIIERDKRLSDLQAVVEQMAHGLGYNQLATDGQANLNIENVKEAIKVYSDWKSRNERA